jgi:hypothetical protein
MQENVAQKAFGVAAGYAKSRHLLAQTAGCFSPVRSRILNVAESCATKT